MTRRYPHGTTRLTVCAVREIRANRRGETAHELAARYGVHKNTIDRVRWREVWKWVR